MNRSAWVCLSLAAAVLSFAAACADCSDSSSEDAGGSDDGGVSVDAAHDGGQAGDAAGTDSGGTQGELVEFSTDLATIPVQVTDHVNVARQRAPVSGGIPLARGLLQPTDVSRLVLANSAGYRVLSFQEPVVLGRWSDGSVKWLLLDFQADLPANGTTTFTLGLATADTSADPAVVVTETADSFTIDTGRLKAVISKQRFSLLEEAWVDLDGDGQYAAGERVVDGPGEMFIDLDDAPPGDADSGVDDYPAQDFFGMEGGNWLRDSQAASATRYLASAGDYEISIFRQGRSHVVFKLEGWHREPSSSRQFAKYTLYLHFYAGRSDLRLSHTWIMTGDPEQNFIRRMAVELPFAGGGALAYAAGGPFETEGTPVVLDPDHPPYIPLQPGPSQVHSGELADGAAMSLLSIGPDKYYHNLQLEHVAPVEYALREDDSVVASGEAAAGWMDVSDGALGLAAGVRDFWREHPKELRFADGKLAVFLWPDRGDKTLDLRRRYPELRGSVGEGFGTAARREFVTPGSAVGIAKTNDIFFYLHPGNHAAAAVDDAFRSFQDPLLPFVSAEHNVATGVFGSLVPYDPTTYTKLENFLDYMMARIIRSQREYEWYGMLDHGDYLPEFGKQTWELDIPDNPDVFSNWGYAGWLQEAYRFGQFAFVQYFRSGRYDYFRAADVWLRHTRDVDCVYWDAPDDGPRPTDAEGSSPRVGGGHRHDQQHWGAYMTGYGIPTIAVVHHYFMTGNGRDLDAMRANADWILNAGTYYENYSEYSVLYMAEALDDAALMAQALAHNETPQSAFGRATYDSGMGLLLHDVHTGGDPAVREKLRAWADLDESSAGYLRGYLESQEQTGAYTARIQSDLDAAFPTDPVTTRYYEEWAPRIPDDFRDAFSADIMPDGPFGWPLRLLEDTQFNGPGGMGYDLGRHSNQMALMWAMPLVGSDL